MSRNAPSKSHSKRLRTANTDNDNDGGSGREQEETPTVSANMPNTQAGAPQDQLTVMLQWMQLQEERRREEDRAREDRMQQTFMAMLNAQAEREATRAQAEVECRRYEEEQKRLAEQIRHQEEKEREDRQRQAETRKAEERQIEIRQRDAPKMTPMKEDSDVEDFLGEFEIHMEDLRMPVDRWMTYLQPLLTSNARDAIAILSSEERTDYGKVKTSILESCGIRQGRLGDRFWRATKPKGTSYVSTIPKWARLYTRYVGETSSFEEVRDAMLREKLLQTLPPAAATHVRDKNPTTVKEAAIMADRFFEDRQSYPEHPRWQRKLFLPKQQDKPSRPAITEGDKTDLLTTQTEKPGQLTPSSAQGKKTTERLKGPQYYHCHEWGAHCSKVSKEGFGG